MSDVATVTAKTDVTTPTQDFVADDVRPIAGLLGLDTHALNPTDAQNIKAIYDFVRSDSREITELEVLHKVRQLEQRLGLTSLGERRVDKLYRYVKLQSQIDGLTKARDGELRPI